MKKLTDVYTEFQRRKEELKTKQHEYNNLSQIGCMDSGGRLLDNQIQVLKGVVKALEWVLS